MRHRTIIGCLAAAFAAVAAAALAQDHDGTAIPTVTPIKHLVVIFQENVSFDHYFGTYPVAKNLPGETPFTASPRTPNSINTLMTPLDTGHNLAPLTGVDLLNHNPNSNPAAPANGGGVFNGAGASNPIRLSPAQALTADMEHDETPEQGAYDNGLMDGFPRWVGTAGPPPAGVTTKGLVMGYYDGNTVTALWNYAQHFGPSTPGAINLISGQTNGIAAAINVVATTNNNLIHPTHEAFGDNGKTMGNMTLIGDADPLLDVCSNPASDQLTMAGRNIGDLLNDKNITWGAFMGGFAP